MSDVPDADIMLVREALPVIFGEKRRMGSLSFVRALRISAIAFRSIARARLPKRCNGIHTEI